METYLISRCGVLTMAGAVKKATLQDAAIEEIGLEACETEELDKLAEETRKCGISWEDLKAELGL